MKNAPTQNCSESVRDSRHYTVGAFPARHDTVRAEVLAALLAGARMTAMESVFKQNTTRLSSHVHALQAHYGWYIQRHNVEVYTNDGRFAWVTVYYLHENTINQALMQNAAAWIESVKTARAKLKNVAHAAKLNAVQRETVRKELRELDPCQIGQWGCQ
jgi:hypothetical protein